MKKKHLFTVINESLIKKSFLFFFLIFKLKILGIGSWSPPPQKKTRKKNEKSKTNQTNRKVSHIKLKIVKNYMLEMEKMFYVDLACVPPDAVLLYVKAIGLFLS